MDTNHTSRNRGRMTISEVWRPLPWRERAVYLLTVILFTAAFLTSLPQNHLPSAWIGDGTLNVRLPEVEVLLLIACFPCFVATCTLSMQRWQPVIWRDFRRLWSVRMVLVGASVLFALGAWDAVIALATPPDQIPPHLPSFLVVPAIAAAGLLLVGFVLAAPEVIIRMSRAKQQI